MIKINKDIKRLLILIIVLTIISTLIIFTFGRTTTVDFYLPNEPYKIKIENLDGEIELINQKEKNNQILLTVKGIKPGESIIDVVTDDNLSSMRIIYVHKTKIVTANSFIGNCNGDIVIPISLSIVLMYSLYILIKTYRKNIKENLYQYRNVAYLGVIIFLSFLSLNVFLSIFNYRGLIHTLDNLMNSTTSISIAILPIAFITFILVTISNINLIIKEGLSIRNLLGLLLGIFICISTMLPDTIYQLLMKSQKINIYNLNGPGPYIYNFIEGLVYLAISYLECILISTIIIAMKSARKKIKYNKDYMIILGCQIKKDGTLTPLLKGRVDKALEFRNNQLKETNKDLIFIASGGKGPDEIISEGEAIKNYLIEQGINKKNILVEDKSTSTYENIKYSNKLINKKNANIAFSTTNYHVFRAGLLATEQGLLLEGVGAKTKAYFWINAFIREFIGTLYSEKKKHILVLLLIIIILIIMISITYLDNNIGVIL